MSQSEDDQYFNDDDNTWRNLEPPEGVSALGALMMACFAASVFCTCCCIIGMSRRRHQRLLASRRASARRSIVERANGSRADLQGRIEDNRVKEETKRYSQIESWIVSRVVLPHGAIPSQICQSSTKSRKGLERCKRQRSTCSQKSRSVVNADGETSRTGTEDVGDDVESASTTSSCPSETSSCPSSGNNHHQSPSCQEECPICYDDFCAGDIVSWSPNPSCNHVFHHACIKQWLLQHEGCPFCRTAFLPIDDKDLESTTHSRSGTALKHVNSLIHAANERARPCFYCVDLGIVYLPHRRPSSLSPAAWDTLRDQSTCTPTQDELENLRGSRTDATSSVSNRGDSSDEEALSSDESGPSTVSAERTDEETPPPPPVINEDESVQIDQQLGNDLGRSGDQNEDESVHVDDQPGIDQGSNNGQDSNNDGDEEEGRAQSQEHEEGGSNT